MSQVNSGLTDLQAGKLLATVEHMRETQSEQGVLLKEINEKMGGYATLNQLEEHRKEVEKEYVKLDDIKGMLAFWNLVTGRLARVIATSAVVAVVVIAAISMLQSISITKPILDKVTRVKEG